MKRIALVLLYLLPFGYLAFEHYLQQPVEWAAFAFMVALAVGLTLLATVFKHHLTDTPEHRDLALKILQRAIRGKLHSGK